MDSNVMLIWNKPGWYAFRAYHARDGTLKVVMVKLLPSTMPRARAEELAASWRLSYPFLVKNLFHYRVNQDQIRRYGEEYRQSLIQKGENEQ